MLDIHRNENTSYSLLIAGMVIGALLVWVIMGSTKKNYSPRHAKNGIDTLFADDSIYAIRLSIDTVYDADIDREAPDYRRP